MPAPGSGTLKLGPAKLAKRPNSMDAAAEYARKRAELEELENKLEEANNKLEEVENKLEKSKESISKLVQSLVETPGVTNSQLVDILRNDGVPEHAKAKVKTLLEKRSGYDYGTSH